MKRAYGFRPSPPDHRDKIADPSGLTILDSVDLRDGPMPLVFDQGNLGSCTSQAVAACLQYDASLDLVTRRARRRSRLSIYYGERELEGSLGQGDTGAYGRDGFKYAQQTGVLLEAAWPYTDNTFVAPVGSPTYAGPPPAGTRHKLTKPYALVPQTESAIKAALSNRQLVAFGFTVYESFESSAVDQGAPVPMPSAGEATLGGHEVCVVGYDAADPAHCIVRNSWSSGWCQGGYCRFPWAYLLDASLASDLRTIVRSTA